MVFGAALIAQTLHDLGVQVLFGLPGLPVIDIAQESMNLGINFISFRNEQAAVLAASAYGYLTGRPGVCICVGGPGVLNTFAGVSAFSFHGGRWTVRWGCDLVALSMHGEDRHRRRRHLQACSTPGPDCCHPVLEPCNSGQPTSPCPCKTSSI
jgi:hypothetical protein